MLHDVDLLPEDNRNLYTCSKHGPRHMSVLVSTLGYFNYGTYFGGVTAISRDQMEKVNGFSNLYFGWGGEGNEFII